MIRAKVRKGNEVDPMNVPASRLMLPPGPWRTVLEALCARFPRIPESQWRDRFIRGRVLDRSGVPLPLDAPYRPGAQVQYFREVAEEPALPGGEYVVHCDADLLVAFKPHYLPVAPTGAWVRETLLTRMVALTGNSDLAPLHRLDRDTSGVLLLGKGPEAAKRLAGAFARRQAKKTYWAIVAGNPKPPSGLIEMHLKKSGLNDFEMVRPADPKEHGAEPAETGYVMISRAAHRAAWMALRPFTGRTHQLRAHMKAIGHPILGDPKYGDEASTELSGPLKLQLHARRIELDHPGGGKLVVEAPLSPEMKAGFAHFGFDEHEAPVDPFPDGRRRR